MNKLNYLLMLGLIVSLTTSAQDTLWISKRGTVIPSKDSAESYNVIYKSKSDKQEVKVILYLKDGTIEKEINYLPYSTKTLHGLVRTYINGKVVDERTYAKNLLQGSHRTFWGNGNLKRNDVYERDSLVGGKCFGFNGGDTTWFAYKIQASFPGGTDSLRQYLAKHVNYPPDARKTGIGGTVKVRFTITKDGSLSDIKLLNNVDPFLDKEAMRVVSEMPRWLPAMIDGKAVNTLFILPVVFRLLE